MKKPVVINAEIHTDFKVECARQKKQMAEMLEMLIKEWLKKLKEEGKQWN